MNTAAKLSMQCSACVLLNMFMYMLIDDAYGHILHISLKGIYTHMYVPVGEI